MTDIRRNIYCRYNYMSKAYKATALEFSRKVFGSRNAALSGFYNDKIEYFNFDALWTEYAVRRRVAAQLSRFIRRNVRGLGSVTKILGTDTVTVNYSFGTLPLAGALADTLEKDLLIWSETGDLPTGQPKLYGQVSRSDKVLIIHDLLRETITLKSLVTTLLSKTRCRIAGIIVLVNTTSKTELRQLGDFKINYPVPIHSFVSTSEK